MTKPLPFEDETFDLIFHPVSNCYVKEVKPIFKECARILKHGGILLSGLDNGVNYLVDDDEERIVNTMPFDPLTNADHRKLLEDTDCGMQFSHTVEEYVKADTILNRLRMCVELIQALLDGAKLEE